MIELAGGMVLPISPPHPLQWRGQQIPGTPRAGLARARILQAQARSWPQAWRPFAIGTETWGSIICPSAFCGVSGLRALPMDVSAVTGAMALAPSMDKIGPDGSQRRGLCTHFCRDRGS